MGLPTCVRRGRLAVWVGAAVLTVALAGPAAAQRTGGGQTGGTPTGGTGTTTPPATTSPAATLTLDELLAAVSEQTGVDVATIQTALTQLQAGQPVTTDEQLAADQQAAADQQPQQPQQPAQPTAVVNPLEPFAPPAWPLLNGQLMGEFDRLFIMIQVNWFLEYCEDEFDLKFENDAFFVQAVSDLFDLFARQEFGAAYTSPGVGYWIYVRYGVPANAAIAAAAAQQTTAQQTTAQQGTGQQATAAGTGNTNRTTGGTTGTGTGTGTGATGTTGTATGGTTGTGGTTTTVPVIGATPTTGTGTGRTGGTTGTTGTGGTTGGR